MLQDCPADKLGELWLYGVGEPGKSVHPAGNPIIHVTKLLSCRTPTIPPVARYSSVLFTPELRFPEQQRGVGSGVSDDPGAIASVRRAKGGRRYAIPLRVIPERGHIPENRVQPSREQGSHVLQQEVERSNHANGSHHLAPKAGPATGQAGAETCEAEILTGESSANDICIGELRGSHVAKVRNSRPMSGENAAGVSCGLAEGDRLKPASASESKVEATDPGKEGEHPHHNITTASSPASESPAMATTMRAPSDQSR